MQCPVISTWWESLQGSTVVTPLQTDDSPCFALSWDTWYIFITLDTLAWAVCFWLHLQPSLLVFIELNINMFAKRDEFPYTSVMFKISFLDNSCSFSSNVFPKPCETVGWFISNSFPLETFLLLASILTVIPTLEHSERVKCHYLQLSKQTWTNTEKEFISLNFSLVKVKDLV